MGNYNDKYNRNNVLIEGLFSKTRQAVLALLYGQTDKSFYTKQILDAVNTGRGAVQRELKNLTDAGIIIREVQGRQVYYRANERCLIFNELKSVVLKITKELNKAGQSGGDAVSRRFKIKQRQLNDFCRRNHIKRLSLFGSVLRKDFRPDSDIDVLVEFESGHVPGFAIVDMENELSRLSGRKVDLRTPADLGRYFRKKAVKEARIEYECTQP